MISRGSKGLANRYRPRMFSELIGLTKLVNDIRAAWEKPNRPMAYLLSGSTGSGKTTVGRIMAVSANCGHQVIFGEPCVNCRKKYSQFDISEVNASDVTGIDKIREVVSAYEYVPTPPSLARVYLLDEAQRISEAAQNFLLKPFEDGPKTTLWIIATTNELKILPTLRGRCVPLKMPPFGTANTGKLVRKVIESERAQGLLQDDYGEEKIGPFIENLVSRNITTPRNILMQLEKFLSSGDPECVFNVEVEGDIRLGRWVYEGSWDKVREALTGLTEQELMAMRYSLMSYFRAVMLNSKTQSPVNLMKLSKSLTELAEAVSYDDVATGHKILAAVYNITQRFGLGGK